ncbi:phospholipid-transporting ATPase IK [Hylobates moloch]|uniref:phospholipid-transporting ATPase IK n=1 Tax=Hylobates moloch TaxID=81572 RepID=UPI0026744113|nr:phospholipid-transporting ATPase IK [Hylobates moloch]
MVTGSAQTPRSTRAGPEPSPAPPGPGDTGDSDVTQEGSGPASIRGGEKVIRAGMGDSPGRGAPQRRHKAQAVRAGKYEQRLEGPTSMGSLSQREDLQDEDRNSAFTWEVQANNRAYNAQFKEKVFLCWRRKKYKTNVVRTAKYSFFSFLPLNLYEQFHRVSNLYFLLIIILQSIPDISTLPWFSLGAPMVCLLFIRAARDLVDDIGRHKSDRAINNRPCQILMGKSFKRKKWQDLCVGDVVCLRKDNIVPADVLLLASTEPSSLCYVETVDIDGETNLKFRQALMVTHKELTTTKKMASFQGTVMCEAPNSRMHHFVGCLEWNDKKYSLDIGNLLLRGCRIRNTDTCYGLVIYAGFDTKIMKNCGKIHLKRTKLDLLMNKLVVVVSCQQVPLLQEHRGGQGQGCHLPGLSFLILQNVQPDPVGSRILETYWENSNNLLTKKSLSQVKLALVINGDFLDKLLVSLREEPRALVQNVNMDKAWQEPGQSRRDFLYARRLSLLCQRFGLPLAAPPAQDSGARRSSEVLLERAFVDLASKCQAVICCRVTPKQKALIVALVKKYHQVVTLAIGDGANDINMIKTADVGVGLAGQEGMQAVQNSDFVLGQFCFLQRLLLVHGHWSYVRICKFLRYSFYKTMASMMVQVWFACYNGFTGQPLYEGWFLALFNLLYSTLPVLYIGLFEQDVSAEQSLEKPELYVAGQKDELFNYWVFVQAIAHGVTTSLVNFFMTLWISRDTAGPASFSDHQSFAVVVALSCLLSITMEVILIIRYWTALCVATILLSLGFYAVMTTTTQSFWLFRVSPKTFPFLYADLSVLSSPSVLLVVLLSVSINTVPVLALRVIFPALKELRAKEEKVEEGPSEDIFTVEPLPHVYWESRARRSSYAFSHHEGYADLITQGTILRRGPGVSSDIASESLDPSDKEASSSAKESHWHLRKKSFLGKKKCQPQGLVSSQEVQRLPTPSSSFSMDRQSALHSENQRALPKYVLTSTNRLSGSFQEQLPRVQERPLSPKQRPPSPEKLLLTKERSQSLQEKPPLHRESQPSSSESQPQLLGSQSLLSGQLTLESQPDSSEEKSAFLKPSTPFWKSWQKEPHTPKEGTAPLPDKTHKSQVETRPPSLEESSTSTSEQPMEVEPWPAERQSSSSMEWLLVPGEEQPSLPPEEQSLPSVEGTRGQK